MNTIIWVIILLLGFIVGFLLISKKKKGRPVETPKTSEAHQASESKLQE